MTTGLSSTVHRVLDQHDCRRLDDYVSASGGRGLAAARRLGSVRTIEELHASGLRGRGGAGFPTGVKWRTVANAATRAAATPIVVNGAEGEPGTFKDRLLIRRNPFKILEGALIAADAIGATKIVVALKASFEHEQRILTAAIDQIVAAGWASDVDLSVVLGPSAYLFGEETALLEVIEGRQPFPRVAPPYRRGLDPNDPQARRDAATVRLAGPGGTDEAPALVDNVETLANVPAIMTKGADWFRTVGTAESPGTLLCTITGRTRRHGVDEVAMGTPLGEIINLVGGGPRPGRVLVAALSGVANPIVPAARFDTPATYEHMAAIGSGLGAGGFIVFDDESDLVAVAHAAARFLAVESCGQCEPCKLDGLAVAHHLDAIRTSNGTPRDITAIENKLRTVTRGARCFLAQQQERVIGSILTQFPDAFAEHLDGHHPSAACELLAPIVDIVGGRAVLDISQRAKQPDWTYEATDSGAAPADRYVNQPVQIRPPRLHEPPLATSVDDGPQADPFAEVRVGHQRIRHSLAAAAAAADWTTAEPALRDLLHHLQVHNDITADVLYPMLERAAGEAGEDAAAAPHQEIVAALQMVEHMLRDGPPLDITQLGAVAELAHLHTAADEDQVLPLLRQHLDPEHTARLRDALAVAMKWRIA